LQKIIENTTKQLSQVEVAQKLYGIYKTIESVANVKLNLSKFGLDSDEILKQVQNDKSDFIKLLTGEFDRVKMNLDSYNWEVILSWDEKVNKYKNPFYSFKVRDKEINIATHTESLSHSQIPKVALPKYQAWGDILKWNLQENVPGEFPFASGLYPFKREGEDPSQNVCR
jgi:methylmalonyl-CoA mutase